MEKEKISIAHILGIEYGEIRKRPDKLLSLCRYATLDDLHLENSLYDSLSSSRLLLDPAKAVIDLHDLFDRHDFQKLGQELLDHALMHTQIFLTAIARAWLKKYAADHKYESYLCHDRIRKIHVRSALFPGVALDLNFPTKEERETNGKYIGIVPR